MARLSLAEFTQFNLYSKMQILRLHGKCVTVKVTNQRKIALFCLNNYYVNVCYSKQGEVVENIEPVTSNKLLAYY